MSSISSLTEWAHAFTHGLFESPESEWLAFFDRKVASDVQIILNGQPATAAQLKALFVDNRERFVSQKIKWKDTVELPKDPSKPREAGIVAGFYTNTGLYRNPKDPKLPAFLITRTPHIYIESENPDSKEDTRRLVRLTIIVTEIAVGRLDE